MTVSIHQPGYFPWLGLLDKINRSDIFIILDSVQLNDNAFQSRNIFLNHRGEVEYLTIPVIKKEYLTKSIRELKIADKRWQKKHHGFIISNYKKHPFFDEIYPMIELIFHKNYTFLIDVLLESMYACYDIFGIKTENITSSGLEIGKGLTKDDLVLALLKKTGATKYISGTGAKNYQDEKKFESNDIILEYQTFRHPEYLQKNSSECRVGLSSLDIAFNLGIAGSRKILQGLS